MTKIEVRNKKYVMRLQAAWGCLNIIRNYSSLPGTILYYYKTHVKKRQR